MLMESVHVALIVMRSGSNSTAIFLKQSNKLSITFHPWHLWCGVACCAHTVCIEALPKGNGCQYLVCFRTSPSSRNSYENFKLFLFLILLSVRMTMILVSREIYAWYLQSIVINRKHILYVQIYAIIVCVYCHVNRRLRYAVAIV